MIKMDRVTTHRQRGRGSVALVSAALLGMCLTFSSCGSPEAREARYIESGKRQMENKDYARAAIQFFNASKVMPKDAEPHYQLALVFFAQRQYDRAVASLQTALKLNPKHQQAQLKLAELMIFSKKREVVELAQQKVQQLVDTMPPNAEALDALASAEWKLGNQQDAEKKLEAAVSKFPQHLASAVSLSQVKRAHNDLPGAEAVLHKAAAQLPSSPEAFLALGQFYMTTGKGAQAETQFRHAIQLNPKSGPAILSLAVLQVRTGKLDPAEQTYAQLSALPEPQYLPYHAAFLAARGKHAPAIAEFEKLHREHPDDRSIRTYLVREYVATHQTGEADKLLTAALRKNSKDVDAHLQRGSLYLMTGQVNDALQDLSEVLHFRADSPEAHYLMSRVHEMRGASLNQRQELGEVLRLRPDFLLARIQLARALIASGAAQSALDLINGAPPSQRNNLEALVQKNWALLALNQPAEARKEVDRELAAIRAPELLLQDAYLKLTLKEFAAARKSLIEALNKSPDDLRVLRMMVASYAAEKQPEAALRAIQDYAAQRPKSAAVQQYFGELLLASGRRAEARTALLAAKTLNPKSSSVDLSLAQLDFAEGRFNEAIQTLSAVLQGEPKNIPAQFLLAGIQDSRGNHTVAVDRYKKILELQPANVAALNNLAYDLAEYIDQPDEALKLAQKAAELAPDVPAVENTLGWALYHKGLYSMALPHLERAADKEPNARRKCHVAMAYLKLGDQERGEQNLETAMKLDPALPEIRAAEQILEEMQRGR
jgi:tetratricopeptide (TPR) repeat protein